MRALVTGGCGFIGSHVVDLLVKNGAEVRVVDNLSTGRIENLRGHLDSGRVTLYEGSVSDPDLVADAMTDRTHVFHLAALADIVPSIVDPMSYFASNVTGTAVVMEAARRCEVEKVVYAASSSCYGIPDAFPTDEMAEPRPQYPYALTKWMGEEIVCHWNHVYGIPTVSLRLFNVFGPRARTTGTYGAVFGVFLAQKIAREPMTVVGTGEQTRDFTFVSDVARAFHLAAESPLTGEIMNVGSGNTYSINYLVDLLGGPRTFIPRRPGEPDTTFAAIERIQEKLGWNPETSFEDGVAIMLAHIDDWREAPVWKPDSIARATEEWFRYLR